jgi:diguanylate cyclase (GGDEF)-like protein/PAS domain S-box-containing protein
MISDTNSPQQGTLSTKIGIGFLLVMCIFMFVIWRHQIAINQSLEDFNSLREKGEARKEAAFNIQRLVLEARQAESDFLLSHDQNQVVTIKLKVNQIQSLADKLDSDSDIINYLPIKDLMTAYLKQFQAIAQAWENKGLDHESGLQGVFRTSVHEMEDMATIIAKRKAMIGVVLEKEILMLRRHEKDYLLRGNQKYVQKVKNQVGKIRDFISNTTINPKDKEQLNSLLTNYQSNFLSLVNQNEFINNRKKELISSIVQIAPLITDILEKSDQAMNQTIADLHFRSEQHQSTMLYLSIFALLFGIITTIIVILQSSTLHKKLISSMARMMAVVDNAVDGIITINHKGIIESVNPAVEDIFGYTSEELIGQNISILTPSPHREVHDSYINNFLETGERKIIGSIREVEGVCKDGGRFPIDLAVSAFKIDGQTFFTGILHDITERKQAKDALDNAYKDLEQRVVDRTKELEKTNVNLQQEIEERARAEESLKLAAKVFEKASEAILITDNDGKIITVNQAFVSITGFQREEVIGHNPKIGKSGRHDKDFYKAMWAEITNNGSWSGEIWDRRKTGEVYPKWLTINAVHTHNGDISHFVGIFSDISHIKATEERLEQLAFYDPLTNLPNRMLFKDRLLHEFELAKRNHKKVGVFFIDLDRFKHVNDTLGHAAGDTLLEIVAQRLTDCVRSSDTVARLGGDEFTVILSNLDSAHEASSIAGNIIESLMSPVPIKEHTAHIGASIGISIYPDDGEDYATITKYADVAMYHAKDSGRGNFKFFKTDMNENSVKRSELERNMRSGIENSEFILYYQPKLCIATGQVTGMEALVRWVRPDGSMVSPADFIPLAEDTGLIIPMGKEILNNACKFNTYLVKEHNLHIRVAVNLSPRQFQQNDLHEMVEQALKETELDPSLLELEVTESMMMEDENTAIATLKKLNNIGVSIAMDDFGTGYSSLSFLKHFPIHTLKVDQSFVRDLTVDSDDAAIVLAVVSMAKSLRLHVIAEGVETIDQLNFLKDISSDEIQGYYFSKPLPEDHFIQFVKKNTESNQWKT